MLMSSWRLLFVAITLSSAMASPILAQPISIGSDFPGSQYCPYGGAWRCGTAGGTRATWGSPGWLACSGDCNDDRRVSINELILGIGIVLGTEPEDRCWQLAANPLTPVNVGSVIAAVSHSLQGCP